MKRPRDRRGDFRRDCRVGPTRSGPTWGPSWSNVTASGAASRATPPAFTGTMLKKTGPESLDHSIGCEKCHGPGGHHELSIASDFSGSGDRRDSRVVSSPDQSYLPHVTIFLVGNRSRNPGPIRPSTVSNPWAWAGADASPRSHGELSCVTCHDPHRNVQTSTSINESRCLSCHAGSKSPSTKSIPSGNSSVEPRGSPEKSSRKQSRTVCPVNPANRCLKCPCHDPGNRSRIPSRPITSSGFATETSSHARGSKSGCLPVGDLPK